MFKGPATYKRVLGSIIFFSLFLLLMKLLFLQPFNIKAYLKAIAWYAVTYGIIGSTIVWTNKNRKQ
ncbi:hypothetical protein D1835_09085 [Enterococcus asini]|nr:hypothetical protein [Enterococcus asini]